MMSPEGILFIYLAAIMGWVGFVVSVICVSIVVGMSRATHTVAWKEVEPHKNLPEEEDSADEDLEKELDKVGRKQKTAIRNLDEPIEEISKSDINF